MKVNDTPSKVNHQGTGASGDVYYAGFWSRVLGFVVDIFMIGIPVSILIMLFFGYDAMQEADTLALLQGKETAAPDPLISWVQLLLSLAIYVGFWYKTGQTPGKKLAMIRIVDASTYGKVPLWRLVIRFLAYFLSFISLVGFFLPLMLRKKQALHDLLSGTVVIYTESA